MQLKYRSTCRQISASNLEGLLSKLKHAKMEIDGGAGSSSSASGAYNLVITAARPSAVINSVVGHFTSQADINLVIA
jgi:hypothetical protein